MNAFESAKSESIKILGIVKEYHHLTLLDQEVLLIRTYLTGALKRNPQTRITPTCTIFWDPKSSKDRASNRSDLRMIKRNELIESINRLLKISEELQDQQIQLIAIEISEEIEKCQRSIRNKRRPIDDGNSTEPVMEIYPDQKMTNEPTDEKKKPKYVRRRSSRQR